MEGLLITMTVLLVVMMLSMALDWLIVLFDHRWRASITLLSLSVAAVTFLLRCIRPLIIRYRLSKVAFSVDRAIPALQERWSTVTELAENNDPPEIRGSDNLIEQVSQEAADLNHLIEENNIVSKQALTRCIYPVSAVAVVLLLLFVFDHQMTSVLMKRFWAPTSDISLTRIHSLTGDRVVPKGEPVILEAQTQGRLTESADLFITDHQNQERITLLRSKQPASSEETPGHFTYKIRSVKNSFDYRLRSGDGQTGWNHINVQERPSIAQVDFKIIPPQYCKLPTHQSDTLPRRCRALKGSRLRLAILPTKPLDRLELKFMNKNIIPLTPADKQWYSYETVLDKSFSFSTHLLDQYGLTNSSPPFCRILVYTDKAPSVEIVSPEEQIVVRPDEKLKIKFKARDDFGIARAELLVTTGDEFGDKQEEKAFHIPLGEDKDSKNIRGETELDLKQFNVKHGQRLSYAVRVTDTRDAIAVSEATPKPAEQKFDPGQALAKAEQTDLEKKMRAGKPGDSGSKETKESPSTKSGQKGYDKDSSDDEQSSEGKPCEKKDQQDMPSPVAQAQQKEQQSSGTQPESAQPPPNNMTMRMLDLEKKCKVCSKKHHILVDKWAGSFDGQARKKLQIAINKYLKKLKELLDNAQTNTDQLREHASAEIAGKMLEAIKKKVVNNAAEKNQQKPSSLPTWNEPEDKKLSNARSQLSEADKTIVELKGKSANTPYAFISLQLHNINLSHISPAREHLAQANGSKDNTTILLKSLVEGSYHIERARELLAALTKTYQAVKREEQLAETMERVAKMHQVFIEDMQKLLGKKKPTLNPRTGEMIEVPDEFVESLKEYYAKLKELMDELAKALAEDPDLLRRFMAMTRLQGTTIRDQLTLLARRQNILAEQLDGWLDKDDNGHAIIKTQLTKEYLSEQMELAELAAKLHDNTITWMPRKVDADKGPLAQCKKISSAIVLDTRDIVQKQSAENMEQNTKLIENVILQLDALHEQLSAAINIDENNDELTLFCANRMSDVEQLKSRQTGWCKKIQSLKQDDYGDAAFVDQDRLNWDTAEFGSKLKRLMPCFNNLSDKIGTKAGELEELVSTDIVEKQFMAMIALEDNQLESAYEAEDDAVKLFDKSEKLFDDLLTMMEKALAKMPPPTGRPPPPTLEELLAMLEKECKACEKLGLALRMNVALQGDWMTPNDGSGAGAGSGQGSGGRSGKSTRPGRSQQQQQRPMTPLEQRMAEARARAAQEYAKQAKGQAEMAQKDAQARARQMANRKSRPEGNKPGGPGNGHMGDADAGSAVDTRDWNVFVSELSRELRQSRDNVPPETYRQAIEEYFKTITEMAARSNGEE
jgi:hypothetical protein